MPGSISFSLLCGADLEKEYDMFKIHTVNILSIRESRFLEPGIFL